MTISPRKREQLAAFLGGLPNATALKLFAALEVDRAKDAARGLTLNDKGLPHDALLDDLRRQILGRGSVPSTRRLDAKRIFFTLIEDFLVGRRQGTKRRARIARSSLNPIWRLMMSEQMMSEAALAAASLDDALRDSKASETMERSMFIAAEAGLGRLCEHAREDNKLYGRLIDVLGGAAAFHDLQEIRYLLEGVEYLKKLHVLIPTPSPSLTEEQFYELRTLFLAAHDQSETLGAYLLFALKGRLERPWRALGVYYHLASTADDRLRAARETVSLLPDSLFEDIESMARALERDCAGEFDARTAAMRVEYFADYADGLVSQASKIGDNVYVNRVEACRDITGEAHERFAEQALSALRDAMPVRHAGGSARLMSLRPDFAKPMNARMVDDAAAAAALIAKAPMLAERLGVDMNFTSSIAAEASDKIHIFAKDLVVEIRAAEGEERKAARRMLEQILKIASPLLKSDDIGLLRDRAAAAAVTV